MGKGSGRRPTGLVTDKKLQDNWERIFGGKPNNKKDNNGKDKPNPTNFGTIKK